MTAPEKPLPPKSQAEPDEKDALVKGVRLHGERRQRSLREGTPSVARQLAMIGVLGWIIVIPMLVGLFVGHWLDHKFHLVAFWTAPLLLLGLVLGCRSAWKWMDKA